MKMNGDLEEQGRGTVGMQFTPPSVKFLSPTNTHTHTQPEQLNFNNSEALLC